MSCKDVAATVRLPDGLFTPPGNFPAGGGVPGNATLKGITMSQHFCRTTMGKKPVEVLMGWDRPTQGFFMEIFDLSVSPRRDDVIYSHLSERNPNPKHLDRFIEKLKELEISVPQAMLEEIEEDQALNAGNKLRRHDLQQPKPVDARRQRK